MNKELTPLFALERIKNIQIRPAMFFDYVYVKDDSKQEVEIIEKSLKALEIFKNHITNISFKYGGKLGNVIKLQIDCDTCYIHFNENDKNFDLLKEVLK